MTPVGGVNTDAGDSKRHSLLYRTSARGSSCHVARQRWEACSARPAQKAYLDALGAQQSTERLHEEHRLPQSQTSPFQTHCRTQEQTLLRPRPLDPAGKRAMLERLWHHKEIFMVSRSASIEKLLRHESGFQQCCSQTTLQHLDSAVQPGAEAERDYAYKMKGSRQYRSRHTTTSDGCPHLFF